MSKRKSFAPILFFLLILFLLSAYVAVVFSAERNRLSGDAVSLATMAMAPLWKLGVPYRDYWEYKPPGLMLLIGAWGGLFGSTMFSFKILQILFLFGTGPLIYLVFKKIFSVFYALVLASLAAIVLYSPYLSSSFLPAELFGLFFSLLGLVCLLYLEGTGLRFFLGAFFIALASQMEDSFASTILAIVPALIYLAARRDLKSFLRAFKSVLGGILLAVLIVGGYLVATGSLNAYFEVLSFKSNIWILGKLSRFWDNYYYAFWHAKNIFLYFQSGVFTVLLLWFLPFLLSVLLVLFKVRHHLPSFKLSGKNYVITLPLPTIKLGFTPQFVSTSTVVFYSLGAFGLFSMKGFFDFQQLYQVAIPIYFFWSIIIKSILDNLQKVLPGLRAGFLFLPIIVIFLFPKGPYLKSYDLEDYNPLRIVQLVYRNLTPNNETALEDYINSHTNRSSCVLSVYGWSVGETYFYARRRPCSRFFLPHLILEDWQKQEYKENILNNLPQAIMYKQGETDMNVQLFEKEVVNFKKIIGNCYRQDSKYANLYFPRLADDQLKICLRQNVL